ncbi:MAG TPA: dual specificity protein phosphatase family protein [Anaerolineae bacterium]|nr:dual specificity protein phosphatase family protein [Anaerolineae bacterium]
MAAILITQCLQNDFVQPLGRYQPLPNQLHVGHNEAQRLIGDTPEVGPIARTMEWAYAQNPTNLTIIHIRDWHDPNDPFQAEHLRQFGPHCLIDTSGADFAFPPNLPDRPAHIINSPGLNDFVGTNITAILEPFAHHPVRVGLMGVWTEAKITFLAYDLRTRYPQMEIAVCSALTASSSRGHHFMALNQLQRLLGVQIFASIGEFTSFLGTTAATLPLPLPVHADTPAITTNTPIDISPTDRALIRSLFRDCQSVSLRVLDGGYSGNLVFGAESVDLHGHRQAPHVLKIGPQGPIGHERTSFEQIEQVLGNNAPRITAFADLDGRGALKYRYAAMGGGFAHTFQDRYMDGLSPEKTEQFLTAIFEEQLGRFYQAATLEQINLLEYYWFKPEFAPNVRQNVENILGRPATNHTLTLINGRSFPNPCPFYENDLPDLLPLANGSSYIAYVHGDLNGANIIIDAHDNVWLIDFFHTHRGHVIKDLVKLENDLLYIFTPLNNEEDLTHACQLTDILLQVEDLGRPLPPLEETPITHPEMRRAYQTIRFLRSFYPPLIELDRNPLQLYIAQLRYAAHTLSFDEPSPLQLQWALYATGHLTHTINKRLRQRGPLRVDWLSPELTNSGRIGLTLLPGRQDYGRRTPDDLQDLQTAGVTHIVPLITDDELLDYGVPDLITAYHNHGFTVRRLPILDQGVSSYEEMETLVDWLHAELTQGAHILLHCVGGLGRSGLVAACYLKEYSQLDTDAAIAAVRDARSPRAIESEAQETFIARYLNPPDELY